MTKRRTLIAVHGGGALPSHEDYLALWRSALRTGIARDKKACLGAFDDLEFVMPWVGDAFTDLHDTVDRDLDLLDRQRAVAALAENSKTKAFRRLHYERLPGKSALTEFVVGIAAPAMGLIGLGKRAVGAAVPELKHYWDKKSDLRERWLKQMLDALTVCLNRGDSVVVLAHGVGAVAAWDALWTLSQTLPAKKLDLLITLGSPLANNTVRKQLYGAREPVDKRYPCNLTRWHNIAAEDDFLCHDKTVADDFAGMIKRRQISELVDHHVYNLSVRYGRSSPGHSAGYLAHPRTAELLGQWLATEA